MSDLRDDLIRMLSEEERANKDESHSALYAAVKFLLDLSKTTIPDRSDASRPRDKPKQ